MSRGLDILFKGEGLRLPFSHHTLACKTAGPGFHPSKGGEEDSKDDKDVEKENPLALLLEIVKWRSPCGKQFGSSSELKIELSCNLAIYS